MKVHNRDIIGSVDANIERYSKLNDFLALTFQEKSKYDKFSFLEERGAIGLFSSHFMVRKIVCPYKCYPNAKTISLSDYIGTEPSVNIFDVLKRRRSSRIFSKYSISLNELTQLLYYSYGITGKSELKGLDGYWCFRSVPSGGGLYPLELYVYLNDSSLPQGVYHFRPDKNVLELIREGNDMHRLRQNMAVDNITMENSSCIIFVTSVFLRSMLKYSERGYRFIQQEVGFVSQNLSLISEALDLSSCMLGGYLDDEVNSFLEINAPSETIQNVIVIGRK